MLKKKKSIVIAIAAILMISAISIVAYANADNLSAKQVELTTDAAVGTDDETEVATTEAPTTEITTMEAPTTEAPKAKATQEYCKDIQINYHGNATGKTNIRITTDKITDTKIVEEYTDATGRLYRKEETSISRELPNGSTKEMQVEVKNLTTGETHMALIDVDNGFDHNGKYYDIVEFERYNGRTLKFAARIVYEDGTKGLWTAPLEVFDGPGFSYKETDDAYIITHEDYEEGTKGQPLSYILVTYEQTEDGVVEVARETYAGTTCGTTTIEKPDFQEDQYTSVMVQKNFNYSKMPDRYVYSSGGSRSNTAFTLIDGSPNAK